MKKYSMKLNAICIKQELAEMRKKVKHPCETEVWAYSKHKALVIGLGHFISEKLPNLRTIGQKVVDGVRVARNKLSGWMFSATTPVAAFKPALGAGIASAFAIALGLAGSRGAWKGFSRTEW
jgi:hypothetical protein